MKNSRILSFPLLLVGCIFLCTPNLNLFDLLPDFIGYLLLLTAVRRAGEVFPHFDEAHRGFRTLFWINVAKVPAIFIMMYIAGIDLEERGLITIFALGFAVVEWIFAFPAFRNLFEGFVYIGERNGVISTLRTPSGKNVDTLSILTMVFLIIKGATSFLPEIVFLSTFNYNGSLEIGAVNPAVFYPILAIIGIIISLVMGLWWLLSVAPYLRMLEKDGRMQALLNEKASLLADELRASDEKRARRFLLLFLSLGFVFTVDPLIGGGDLLPNAIAAVFFFLAFHFAQDQMLARRGKIFSLVYLAVSIAENIFTARFNSEFVLTDIPFRDVALWRYVPVVALRLLESGLFVAVVLFLAKILKDFVLTHTGKALRPEDLVLRNEVHAEFFLRIKRLTLFSVIYAAMRPVFAVLMPLTERHIITADEANEFYSEGTAVYYSRFAWLWILLLVAGIALAVYAIALVHDIKSETDYENGEGSEE